MFCLCQIKLFKNLTCYQGKLSYMKYYFDFASSTLLLPPVSYHPFQMVSVSILLKIVLWEAYLSSYVAEFCGNITARIPQANHQDSLPLEYSWFFIVSAMETFAFKKVYSWVKSGKHVNHFDFYFKNCRNRSYGWI